MALAARPRLLAALLVLQSVACRTIAVAPSVEGASLEAASYVVTAQSLTPPRFTVRAELPLTDDTLRMERSRPCDLDSLCSRGWQLFVSELRVSDADGRALSAEPIGDRGWVVRDPHSGRVVLEYVVDYRLLAENGWPAPREAAFSDGTTLLTVGRPLFVGTTGARATRLRFVLPGDRLVSGPWARENDESRAFLLEDFDQLSNNALVIAEQPTARVSAGRFSLELALFGRWNEKRELVTRLLDAHLATFTRLLGFDEEDVYLAAFLEGSGIAGEAFVNSYVISADPGAPMATWGRLIGHEIFHYWNGHRIRGADYTSSQWFQEGMSEYYAILSMARNGFMTPDEALAELSRHLRAHGQFKASLAASGNRKNRGFYGSATMVAFALDVTIRDATDGQRSLDDLMREMWRTFGSTGRPYTQADVIAAAGSAAGAGLNEFFRNHVEGDVPLPMDTLLPLAGLKLTRNPQNEETIVEDPSAPRRQRDLWRAVIAASR